MDAKKGAAVVLNGNGDAGTVAHLARTSEIGQIGKTLPVKKAFLTAQVVGSGGNVKILHYSFNKLVQVSALATVFVKGTVFNLDRAVHVAMFSYYVIFALAGGGLYFLGDPLAFEEQSLPPIIEISNDLQRLCPFLFGLFFFAYLVAVVGAAHNCHRRCMRLSHQYIRHDCVSGFEIFNRR